MSDLEFLAFPRLAAVAEVGVVAAKREAMERVPRPARRTGAALDRARDQRVLVAENRLAAIRVVRAWPGLKSGPTAVGPHSEPLLHLSQP